MKPLEPKILYTSKNLRISSYIGIISFGLIMVVIAVYMKISLLLKWILIIFTFLYILYIWAFAFKTKLLASKDKIIQIGIFGKKELKFHDILGYKIEFRAHTFIGEHYFVLIPRDKSKKPMYIPSFFGKKDEIFAILEDKVKNLQESYKESKNKLLGRIYKKNF